MPEIESILLVEDRSGASRTARRLRRAGYEVARAGGSEAPEMLRQGSFALVLLDAESTSAIATVLPALLEAAGPGGPPVVVLEGRRAQPRQRLRILECGARGVIPTPAPPRELLAWVRLYLRNARQMASEAHMEELLQVKADALLVVDAETRQIRFANQAARRMSAGAEGVRVGEPFRFPVEDGAVLELNGGAGACSAEMRVSTVAWMGRPSLVVTLRDATRHLRTQDELKHQTSLLASAQRLGRMGSWSMDLRTRRLEWSPMTCELFGIAPESFSGRSEEFYGYVLEEDRALLKASQVRSRRSDGLIEAEYRIRRPDGEIRWMYERGSVERDASGKPVLRQGMVMDVTDRKRIEAERQELLARERAARHQADAASRYYRSLFESAPGCYLVLTPNDYTIVAVSDAYLQATMTRREQISGRRLFDVFPDNPAEPDADGRRNLFASLKKVERERRAHVMAVQRYPVRRPPADGGGFEERFWSPVNSPVFGPDGKLAYIIHRVEDVTEYLRLKQGGQPERDAMVRLESRAEQMEADIVLRSHELKRANEELERSQAMLRIASRLSQVGGWTVELPGLRMTWTEEALAMHDLSSDELLTLEDAFGFCAPGDRGTIRTALEDCMQTGKPCDQELPITTRKGRRVWLRIIAEAARDASGRIIRLQGAVQDVSQRKEAEEKLQESEERFRLLSQATNDAIWDWNLVTNRLWCNDGMEALLGNQNGDREPFSPEMRLEQVHPEDREHLRADLRQVIAGAMDLWSGRQFRIRRSDGRYATVVDRGYVVRNAAGQPVRIIGGMTDITERVDLAEQLRRSQRLEAVGQLTGGVAHDFNNLLTVILGNAELLSEGAPEDSRTRLLAEMIASAARRGAELTRRLLAFARRQSLHPRQVDIHQLVAGMNQLLHRSLGEQIVIEVRGQPGLWPACVDPGQLENALLNLALNARDAMEAGGRLTIETANVSLDESWARQHTEPAPGDYVLLTVADTGCGIPPEMMGRVFEPFFTTKEPGRGTGLGLAMVYGFIRQSGGHVQIFSEPGTGTTVKMFLPRMRAAAAADSAARLEPPPPALTGGAETVLLVEDDELVRQFTRGQLAGLGYPVLEAENGIEALRLLQDHAVDLLFTDLVMPGGLNGRELARRACALRPGLKVLYTSGYDREAIGAPEPVDDQIPLLRKPWARDELARALRQVLELRPRIAPAAVLERNRESA